MDMTVSKQLHKGNVSKGYRFMQRLGDILLSLSAILLLALPMAVVALLVYIESPGPVIYKQERLGKDGKPFTMYKFRSMHLDAEKGGPRWASRNDVRCTKVGKVIRKWHVDELPQFFNVLKGDMSVVGPRPEREYFYQEFEKMIPNFRDRLAVKQGLTCIAQVNGCYDLTPQQRLDFDMEYIEKQSVWTDLKCVLKTFIVIFNHKGAR